MAASNSQRNWNRFFDHGGGGAAKPGGQKRIRRAKTTCENYEKSTESCRLDGSLCMAPGHCPDYARRRDLDAPKAPETAKRKPAVQEAVRETVPGTGKPEPVKKPAAGPPLSEGHAMAASPDWDPPENGVHVFAEGQVVSHKYFGKGTVVSAENGRIVVEFESAGRKILYAPFFEKNHVMYVIR